MAPRLDDPSVLEPAAIARILGADPERGLTTEAAARRLAEDGPNALRQAPPVPAWRKVLAQFRDPLIYLLLAAIGISLVAWSIEGRVGWPVDAIVIALIVVMNAVLGYVQEAKAENAVAALTRMTAVTSAVVRDGVVARIPSDEVVRGDVLLLGEGDSVGADARLVQAAALRVQEASLTGESEAVLKDATTLPGPVALADRINMVFKGTAVAQGTGRAVVTATGMSTEMGSIAEMLEATKEESTPLQKEVGRIGRMLGIAVIIIAVVVVATVFAISEIRTAADVTTVLLLGVSLAVAAVPEGLPAILSVILAVGVQRMAKRNAVVKKLSSVETLGSASVICSDKTGTLTRSEMTIERVVTASGVTRVTGGRGRKRGGGELIFVGTVGIIDPPREEAAVAIREAHRAGIRVIMITGDHPRTAARIARDLGIIGPGGTAITGLELDTLDDAAFADAVRGTSVYARVAPAHKMRIVDALQADGHIVAMTGDGVNDAPALKSADIGIAMGVTGSEVTKQAAKMILADDNFATIVDAVREGRGIFDNIRKFLRYLLSSNMGEVLTVFLGVVLAGVIGLSGAGDGSGAATPCHANAVDQPDHGLRPGARDGCRSADRRRHGAEAPSPDAAGYRRDVCGLA